MAKKWMRLKMFQLMHTSSLVSCWSVSTSWSYVDRLGLHACKWVASRTGMSLFPDVGWFCFVSMKQRISLHTSSAMYVNDRINTGHNEVISFDLLWNRRRRRQRRRRLGIARFDVDTLAFVVSSPLYMFNEAFRLILSVAFLYLED